LARACGSATASGPDARHLVADATNGRKSDAIHGGTSAAKIRSMGNKTEELKDRIQAKKHELMSRLSELKADSRAEAREQTARIKLRLDELEGHLKEGWDKAQLKLNEWLNRN
jgi:hypothetical protein